MDKKMKTIIIVVLVIVVGGGLFYGINRWRQQRLANKILKEVYGVNTGLLGKITGNSGIANQIAQEKANEEARQQADEAKEAAKTPEDRYNETEEMATYDAGTKAVADEAKQIVEKVFGKAKLTSISNANYGTDVGVYGVAEFTISRPTTGADLGALNKELTDKGLPIIQSGIENKSAGVMAGTDAAVYTFGFEIGGQIIDVTIRKAPSQ